MSNKKKATPAKKKKPEKVKSWAELAAERQVEKDAVYEFKIVSGMDKFTFRREEMIDFLQAGKLPDDMAQYIYERFMSSKEKETEEEVTRSIVKHFNEHLEMTYHLACYLSIEPKLTMNPVTNGKEEFPVSLLTSQERFRLIEAMTRITMGGAEGLKPFRIKSTNAITKPDGKDISTTPE